MSKLKTVTRTYEDGSVETTDGPQTPYNAADKNCQHLGIVEVRRSNTGGVIASGDIILFPDGSVKDRLSGSCHQPPPIGGEYSRQRFLLIQRYWEAVYERLTFEFDRLKDRLSKRGCSFSVQVGDKKVDGVQRLKDLSKQMVSVNKERKNAQENLQNVTPGQRKISDEEIMADQTRQAEFYEQVQEIKRPEDEIEQPQRHSTR